MCRQQFSLQQIEQTLELGKEYFSNKFKWLYAAKTDGWWAFDQRTSDEIEKAYIALKSSVAINIAGYTYTIDFIKMQQNRVDRPSRIRKIKRQEEDETQSDNFTIKGIAGLRVAANEDVPSASSKKEESKIAATIDLTADDDVDLSQTLKETLQIDDDDDT